MGRVVFLNPNDPAQPVGGVYRWFFLKDNREVTLDVGQSGERDNQAGVPCTLYRATSHVHAQYGPNAGGALEADFVVGTAIKYLKSKGVVCFWQHLSNDPRKEKEEIERLKPILQDENGNLKFKRKDDGSHWEGVSRHQAEEWLFERFKKDQDFP